MELNFDVAFAENGQKSDISEDKWLQGWVEIVGGINGVPTAQQFNQFGYVFDKKANAAYAKALEAASDLTSKADKTDVENELSKKASTTDLTDHTSNGQMHITSEERIAWNAKADKSDIPTTLPANGGNAATVNGHTVNADVPANAKFTDTNTTYSAGTGIAISGTTISNSGVRSVATGGSNGTISVNTNGAATNVPVKGLAGAAYQAVQTAAGTIGLHRISSGTAAATTTNCPAGCWYGQYE